MEKGKEASLLFAKPGAASLQTCMQELNALMV